MAEDDIRTDDLFVIRQWAGKPLYGCLMCGFDTLEEGEIWKHVAEHAAPSVVPTPSADEAASTLAGTRLPNTVSQIFDEEEDEPDLKEDQDNG